ncbi:MAG TPA: SPW repeat protein [Anaeromyxobacter sp.]|nr:SPW repeat protein [Anaeromyxobacter sp.]
MPYAEARPPTAIPAWRPPPAIPATRRRRPIPDQEPVVRAHPARVLVALLGVWLFLSGFLWDHADAQRVNAWAIGVLFVAVALVARAAPVLRYANTALAAWLLASVWILPHVTAATRWNDGIVAVLVFALSLTGRSRGAGERVGAAPGGAPA